MCQAPIGKVVSAGKGKLTAVCKGKSFELRSNLPDVRVGDYVLFSTGLAIDKVDKEEAEMILGGTK